MNFRDPNLVLIKRLHGGSKIYFQVCANNRDTVILQDMLHGGRFTFDKSDVENHIKRQVLTICKRQDIPDAICCKPVLKKEKIPLPENQLRNNEEAERRYNYVSKFLDSGIDALTEKKLKPWIEATSKELKDPSPPSYKTLGRWLKRYQQSGKKKNSLVPDHKSKGNHTKRLHPDVEQLLIQVIRNYLREGNRGKINSVYQNFVSSLKQLNDERKLAGLDQYKKISYQAFMKRIKNKCSVFYFHVS